MVFYAISACCCVGRLFVCGQRDWIDYGEDRLLNLAKWPLIDEMTGREGHSYIRVNHSNIWVHSNTWVVTYLLVIGCPRCLQICKLQIVKCKIRLFSVSFVYNLQIWFFGCPRSQCKIVNCKPYFSVQTWILPQIFSVTSHFFDLSLASSHSHCLHLRRRSCYLPYVSTFSPTIVVPTCWPGSMTIHGRPTRNLRSTFVPSLIYTETVYFQSNYLIIRDLFTPIGQCYLLSFLW